PAAAVECKARRNGSQSRIEDGEGEPSELGKRVDYLLRLTILSGLQVCGFKEIEKVRHAWMGLIREVFRRVIIRRSLRGEIGAARGFVAPTRTDPPGETTRYIGSQNSPSRCHRAGQR